MIQKPVKDQAALAFRLTKVLKEEFGIEPTIKISPYLAETILSHDGIVTAYDVEISFKINRG